MALNEYQGYALSTLLLWVFNRRDDNSSSTQKSDLLNQNNTTKLGSSIPVIIGRGIIKEPVVSYFGDFEAVPYTEESGAHATFDGMGLVLVLILTYISTQITGHTYPGQPVTTTGGAGATSGVGTCKDDVTGPLLWALGTWLLNWLINAHQLRTTFQKGFKYYLGWQSILCWTSPQIGIKNIWMNVYDTNLETSTQQAIWSNGSANIKDNPAGIIAKIDKPDLFGGVDEGGGFVGDIRIYFGGNGNSHDSWMVSQMSLDTVQEEVRGLTPLYRQFMTCVIPKAYIGKQSSIPAIWYEIINYPDELGKTYANTLQLDYNNSIAEINKKISYLNSIEHRNSTQESNLASLHEDLTYLTNHGVWTLGKLGEDSNPAEAIYYIITNDFWGCNDDFSEVDINSLLKLGETCERENLGVSINLSSSQTAGDAISRILSHINGVKYDDPSTGKLTFKLIRNDFDEDNLITLTPDNCISAEFTRLDWSETVAKLNVSFTDAANRYETSTVPKSDLANLKITHNMAEKDIDGSYFTTAENAKYLAQIESLSQGYPLASIKLEVNRTAYKLTMGDAFKVSWPSYGITKMIVRVINIDYGGYEDSDTIKIEAIEDVFSFDKTIFEFSNGAQWENTAHPPEDIIYHRFFEAPFELSASLDTYIWAVATNPSVYTVYWDIWRKLSDDFYITVKSSLWTPTGRLVFGMEEDYASNDTLQIKELGSIPLIDSLILTINTDTEIYNNLTGRNIAMIDNELISYNTITKLPNGDYSVIGIIRGIYDTIPEIHTTESIIYFMVNTQNVTSDKKLIGEGNVSSESLSITSESIDKAQDFDISNIYNITTTRRAEQPSLISNLQMAIDIGNDASFYYNISSTVGGNILFKYNQRDKFKVSSVISQTDIEYRGQKIVADSSSENHCIVTIGSLTKEYIFHNNANNMFNITWSTICKDFSNIHDITVLNFSIKTFDNNKNIYSHFGYNKSLTLTVPVLIGIIEEKNLNTFADSVVSTNFVTIESSLFTIQRTVLYNMYPIIMIKSSTGIIMNQNGEYCSAFPYVYRIVGIDNNNHAILNKEIISEGYILKSYFNSSTNNHALYYKLDNINNFYAISIDD